MKNSVISLFGLTILAACGGSGSSTSTYLVEPSAASGYAAPGIDFDTPGEVITASAILIEADYSGSTPSIAFGESSFEVVTTSDPQTLNVTYNGNEYVAIYDSIDDVYRISELDFFIRLAPMFVASNGQMGTYWLNLGDETNGQELYKYTGIVAGFVTSPDDISVLTGISNYSGEGNISISATDDSSYVTGGGLAAFEVDFASGTVTGELEVDEFTGFRFGTETIDSNTVGFSVANIEENSFDLTLDLDETAYGISGFDQETGQGIFYGNGATALGGNATGTATIDSTGGTGLVKVTVGAELD